MIHEIEERKPSPGSPLPFVTFETSSLSLQKRTATSAYDAARTVALLDKMISGEVAQPIRAEFGDPLPGAAPPPSERMKEIQPLIAQWEADTAKRNADGRDGKGQITQVLDHLAKSITQKYKDTWGLLAKENQVAILRLQDAVISGDLKQIADVAKSLKPEVAEKMARLVEKHLRQAGAKVHFRAADGQFLLYQDDAKQAVLIGGDGKASVVAIEANEPTGSPNILEGKRPFKSVQTLVEQIAGNAALDIATQQKLSLDQKPQQSKPEMDSPEPEAKAIVQAVQKVMDERSDVQKRSLDKDGMGAVQRIEGAILAKDFDGVVRLILQTSKNKPDLVDDIMHTVAKDLKQVGLNASYSKKQLFELLPERQHGPHLAVSARPADKEHPSLIYHRPFFSKPPRFGIDRQRGEDQFGIELWPDDYVIDGKTALGTLVDPVLANYRKK